MTTRKGKGSTPATRKGPKRSDAAKRARSARPPAEPDARPVPRGYATRTRTLLAGPGARVTGGTSDAPTPTEKAHRFYEVTLPPRHAREASGDAAAREQARLRRLADERTAGRAHPVRSDYFGTAEHRAAAEYLKELLEGRPPPFRAGPEVNPSHALLRRAQAPSLGTLGAETLRASELTAVGTEQGWRVSLEEELATVFRSYDPVRELEVRAGVSLRYGEIVALAGDYYETPDELEQELTPQVAAAMRNVTPESDGTILLTIHRGGVHYVDLALKNVDHFAPCSWTRYAQHHREALRLAVVERDLERALVRNAFADHFLTDAFASGHLRVARTAEGGLVRKIFQGAQAMRAHGAENKSGLWVQNGRGLVWRAYGDDRLAVNPVHATLVAHALGTSLQRVFAAFAWEGAEAEKLATALDLEHDWTRPPVKAGTVVDPRVLLPAWLGELTPASAGPTAPPALRSVLELIPVPVAPLPAPRAGTIANYPVGGVDEELAESFFETFGAAPRARKKAVSGVPSDAG